MAARPVSSLPEAPQNPRWPGRVARVFRERNLGPAAVAIGWVLVCILSLLSFFGASTRVLALDVAPPPVPAETATLVVTVRAADGAVPGARVRVLVVDGEERYREVGTAEADAAGDVTFTDLPHGRAWLVADKEGHARASRSQLLFGDHRVVLELSPAHALAVSVVDEAGAPIGGATVLVEDQDALPFGALTDAEGRRVFDRLSAPPYRVRVYARGYESQTREDVSADVRFVLRKLGSLLVHVIDVNGSPAPDAQVLVVGSSLWPARRAVTNAEGDATIPGLSRGVYNLKAQLGSKASPELSGIALGHAEHKRVELRLNAGRTLRVRVVDESPGYDEPLEGAQVVLAEYGISSFPVSARTDADGMAFLSPVPAGPSSVSASADGFVARAAVPVPLDPVEVLRIALLRGATLRGDVEDPEGRPIEGARVDVIGTDTDGLPIDASPLLGAYRDAHFQFSLEPLPLVPTGELGITVGPVPFVSEALSGRAFTALPLDYEPWLTDYEGEFRAHPVPPGRVRALVRHPSYVEGLSEEVVLGPGGEARVKVVLSPGAEIEGRVVDENDRPVPLARVTVAATRGSFERSAYAQDDGTFGFAAVPAEVTLRLARPTDPTRYVLEQTLRLEAGERRELELVLPAEREPVTVQVLDGNDRAVELAQVQFTSVDPKVPVRITRFTDSTGRVDFEDLEGLPLRVLVSAPGYLPFQRQFKATPEELDVVLQRGVAVEGRITAVRGRRDVPSARVTLVAGAHRDIAYTDGAGRYRFDTVPPGAVRLTVTHDDFASALLDLEVTETGREDRPFEAPDIDLPEGALVSGRVIDAAGNPVRRARVGLGVAPSVIVQGQLPEGFVLTDAEGRFALRAVAPGTRRFSAYADGVGRGALELEVEEGRDATDVELVLDEPLDEAGVNLAGGGVAITLGERDTQSGVDVVIVAVAAGGEAERAGIVAGDVLAAIGGKRPRDMRAARKALEGRVGSDVVVTVKRAGERATFRVRREAVGN